MCNFQLSDVRFADQNKRLAGIFNQICGLLIGFWAQMRAVEKLKQYFFHSQTVLQLEPLPIERVELNVAKVRWEWV